MNSDIRKLGTVEKIMHYGKCGFIVTPMDEHYYFSPKSFKTDPHKLKEGQLVFFSPSTQKGKPFAEDIDGETIAVLRQAFSSKE